MGRVKEAIQVCLEADEL